MRRLTCYQIVLWIAIGFAATSAAVAQRTRPVGLQPGDTIMLVAPARGIDRATLGRIRDQLEQMGYRVRHSEDITDRRGYLAGTDARRARELMDAFRDPEVDAVFPVTGGFGTTRILDQLDYEVINQNPKVFIGFSDITGLHLALAAKTNMVTFHSPNPDGGWGRETGLDPYAANWFWRAVRADLQSADRGYSFQLPDDSRGLEALRPGVARGVLTGGNLSLIIALMGTPYEIETEGRVLFLEDVHEPPYRVDRYLSQLRLAGKLNSPSAVILGQFTDSGDEAPTLSMQEVFADYFSAVPYPVVGNFPAGHHAKNATLPLGMEVEVDADHKRVRILQAAVTQRVASPSSTRVP